MNKLPNVSSSLSGAPMGRHNNIPNANEPSKLHLQKLQWVDSDYDQGGAYWGCGGRGENIYWAWGESVGFQSIDIFVRAISRNDAKEKVRQEMPRAKFYR